MKNEPNRNFVTLPRQYVSDALNGVISGAELCVLMLIRAKGNPYGVAQVSLQELVGLYTHNVSENHIYKLVRSLVSKRYLYYTPRVGRGGAYEIHLDLWPLPNKGGMKTLERFFKPSVKPSEITQPQSQSEPTTNDVTLSQSYLDLKKRYGGDFKMPPPR